jgi:hypothetical protein
MAEYVANCPRCRASRTTFDVLSTAHVGTHYSWQRFYETFCLCRHCLRTTRFVIAQKILGMEMREKRPLRKQSPETSTIILMDTSA